MREGRVKSIVKKEHHGSSPTAILHVRQWMSVCSGGCTVQKYSQTHSKGHTRRQTLKQVIIRCILKCFMLDISQILHTWDPNKYRQAWRQWKINVVSYAYTTTFPVMGLWSQQTRKQLICNKHERELNFQNARGLDRPEESHSSTLCESLTNQ